jgi:hypothetical protein
MEPPVSGTSKRKLENGEQRLAPENHRPGTKSLKIADQRLGHTSLTRRNVGGSPTPGDHTAKTALAGWRQDSNLGMAESKSPRRAIVGKLARGTGLAGLGRPHSGSGPLFRAGDNKLSGRLALIGEPAAERALAFRPRTQAGTIQPG